MSDIDITVPEPEPEKIASAADLRARSIAQQRRYNMAKARMARDERRAERTANSRTAADAARQGVAAQPGPAARAEPTREKALPAGDFVRRRRVDRQVGVFDDLPMHRKKPGWDYQWITIRVLAQPVDRSNIRDFRENGGWQVQLIKDWPEYGDPSDAPDAPVETGGQMLVGRPLHLTEEARAEDYQAAVQQQRDRMVAAASGRSAIRGEEGMPSGRVTRVVPLEISLEGVAG